MRSKPPAAREHSAFVDAVAPMLEDARRQYGRKWLDLIGPGFGAA
jgi:hypothetical protein